MEAKLGNAAFLERAPQPVVAKERERLAGAQERIERLQARLRGAVVGRPVGEGRRVEPF